MSGYREEDFDDRGNLRLRKGMWCALFLLAHPWWLLAFEMSLSEGKGQILSVIYPTTEALYAGLFSSAPVFLFLFIIPFRQDHPVVILAGYSLLILGSMLSMLRFCLQLYQYAGGDDEALWLSLLLLNLGCLVEVWPDRRNLDTFYFWPRGKRGVIRE
ncbi:DUF2919 domain-containing protein [Escherichia coli]|uniref:DUF2919 family protein n=1 Tax=Enterobacteriaceae TaxID=543 RepID=UPI0003EEFD1C|nr:MULTISPECIES: DUF2919 family protein [Enterobacteriaceae]EFE7464698.1 DUF2919 family protein [Escherichia coli]EFE7865978.1 DUF2919 family protein [Escherichia coli]EFH8655916.1 DUF2919 family protein [Escherichia coli]EFI6331109.1 DUF2919 family protein [Escherichia coli]EFJ2252497.1 DUF2919 family protein [Escherichia coli]